MAAIDASERARTRLQLQEGAERSAALASAEVERRGVLRALFLGLGAASLPSWVPGHAAAHAQGAAGPELGLALGLLRAQDHGLRVPARDGGWAYASSCATSSGGWSSRRFDAADNLVADDRSCTGRPTHCPSGATPWGTWITCAEVTGGWAYECDPFRTPSTRRRLCALGARDGRVAVAIDPVHHACYQTLHTGNGKLVRFVSEPDDLESTPRGIVRMRMRSGTSQRLYIPPSGSLPGYANTAVPNTAAGSARLRQARPVQWLADSGSNGTNFDRSEGVWYHEVPESLRTRPSAGVQPTRGVIFFATQGDRRIWAIDIEDSLIELVYDSHGGRVFPDLRPGSALPAGYNPWTTRR